LEARLRTICVLLVLCAVLSCGSARDHASSAPPGSPQTPSETTGRKEIAPRIASVELLGSWKGSDVKLVQWKDSDDPNIPHPDVFDVLCTVENKTDAVIQEGDFLVVTTVDFTVAPTYAYAGDINKLIAGHTFSRLPMDDLKFAHVPYLRPHDQAQLRLKGFELGQVLKQFDGTEHTLWPWALRVNVRVMNREMTPVMLDQITLPIFPSDKRLAAE
jgi:hypothetical protein